MAQKTQLSVLGTPGQIRTFTAKTAITLPVGKVSATFSTANPGAAFTVQQPSVQVTTQSPAITFAED